MPQKQSLRASGDDSQVDLAFERQQQQMLEDFLNQESMDEAFDMVKKTYKKVGQWEKKSILSLPPKTGIHWLCAFQVCRL